MAAFTKGDPRINRRGRPKKGAALTDILSFKLDQKNDDGKLRREVIAEKLIAMAEAGDMAALRYVIDRLDGRPKETVEVENSALEIKLMEILNGK
jgi:type II secretory pathway component GspD/PulD (secretin)